MAAAPLIVAIRKVVRRPRFETVLQAFAGFATS